MICSKEGYNNYKEAVVRMISLSRSVHTKHKYNIYKCEICGLFHISTSTKYMKRKAKHYRRLDKYPVKIDDFKKTKPLPPVKPLPMYRHPFIPATQKLITPLQATILKHIIERSASLLKT